MTCSIYRLLLPALHGDSSPIYTCIFVCVLVFWVSWFQRKISKSAKICILKSVILLLQLYSVYVPCNLQIYAFLKLRCAVFWKMNMFSSVLHPWLVFSVLGFVFRVSRSTFRFFAFKAGYSAVLFTHFTIPQLILNPRNLDVGFLTLNTNPTLHPFPY